MEEVLGSNPRFGTRESEPGRVLGLAANECAAVGREIRFLRSPLVEDERATTQPVTGPARYAGSSEVQLLGCPLGAVAEQVSSARLITGGTWVQVPPALRKESAMERKQVRRIPA